MPSTAISSTTGDSASSDLRRIEKILTVETIKREKQVASLEVIENKLKVSEWYTPEYGSNAVFDSIPRDCRKNVPRQHPRFSRPLLRSAASSLSSPPSHPLPLLSQRLENLRDSYLDGKSIDESGMQEQGELRGRSANVSGWLVHSSFFLVASLPS